MQVNDMKLNISAYLDRVRKWIIDTDGVCDDMARKSSKLNKNCTDHNICSKVPPGHQVRKCI